MRSLLATAAVIAVGFIGVLGVSQLAANDREFAIQDAVSEALAADGDSQDPVPSGETVIVWLSVGVSDAAVANVADWLNREPAVSGYSYTDQAETYLEFREYFADEPEILELVRPEQLPTSFVVTTNDPTIGTGLQDRFAAVESVEIGGYPDSADRE